MKLHYFLFPIIKVEDTVILTSKSFSLKHCAKRVGLPNRYLLQGGFSMKRDYIEEYIQLSPEEMKKKFFAVRLLVVGWGVLTLLGFIDYHRLRAIFAISLMAFFLCGWFMSKNMANCPKNYFLYSGIGFLWVSVFDLIKMTLHLEKMMQLNQVKVLIAYGIGYLFTLVAVSGYQMWALQQGRFTEVYKKKHAKMDAFLLGVMSIIPGAMLIVNSVLKYIFGAEIFYQGLTFAVSFIPFLLLYMAIPFFYKYYLIKKYQVRVERVSSDESVGR